MINSVINSNNIDPLHLRLDRKSEKIMYIIAGCNGAGKTTAFRDSLYKKLGCPDFINADDIAREICPENVESVKIRAGREALGKMHSYLSGNESFCVETTLATKIYRGHIQEAHKNGFKVALFYYWLDSADLAVARVEQRVAEGGHNIPEAIIRERYDKSVKYLSSIYLHNVDYWKIVNNSGIMQKEIATSVTVINNRLLFNNLMSYGNNNQNK